MQKYKWALGILVMSALFALGCGRMDYSYVAGGLYSGSLELEQATPEMLSVDLPGCDLVRPDSFVGATLYRYTGTSDLVVVAQGNNPRCVDTLKEALVFLEEFSPNEYLVLIRTFAKKGITGVEDEVSDERRDDPIPVRKPEGESNEGNSVNPDDDPIPVKNNRGKHRG
ncbi:MAG: hypothetical protein V1754_01615 [Pseudomonadota bacterium]